MPRIFEVRSVDDDQPLVRLFANAPDAVPVRVDQLPADHARLAGYACELADLGCTVEQIASRMGTYTSYTVEVGDDGAPTDTDGARGQEGDEHERLTARIAEARLARAQANTDRSDDAM